MKTISEQTLFNHYYEENCSNGSLIYLGNLLQRAAHQFPKHTALFCEEKSITYAHLYDRAVALSKKLVAQGIKPRDRVLLFMHNSIEFYVAYYAVVQVGAVIVPLNTFLKDRELAHIIHDAQPSLIIASSDLIEILEKADGQLPPYMTERDIEQSPVPSQSFSPTVLDNDEMVALLYTSGTTGVPKGVMLSSNNIINNVLQGLVRFKPVMEDRIFAVLPLFHSFAQNICVWTPMFLGLTIIIVPRIERRFILKGLTHKPTIFPGVPALYGLLCLMKTAPLSSVKVFISGGDALSDKIRAAFALIYRRNICSGYGMTETSPFVSGDFDDEAMPTNTVGRPLVQIQTSLRDEHGNEVAQGSVGELWLKGPNVMMGYYKAAEATQAVIHDGWLSTGDLAYVDRKGRIVITGRYKDLIKHKGINIYPQEVENIIMTYPNVLQVGVIGQKDEMTGEIPIAYVQLRSPEEAIEKKLLELCAKNLANYKIPRSFICSTDQLPTTVTGKVDKKKLRLMHE